MESRVRDLFLKFLRNPLDRSILDDINRDTRLLEYKIDIFVNTSHLYPIGRNFIDLVLYGAELFSLENEKIIINRRSKVNNFILLEILESKYQVSLYIEDDGRKINPDTHLDVKKYLFSRLTENEKIKIIDLSPFTAVMDYGADPFIRYLDSEHDCNMYPFQYEYYYSGKDTRQLFEMYKHCISIDPKRTKRMIEDLCLIESANSYSSINRKYLLYLMDFQVRDETIHRFLMASNFNSEYYHLLSNKVAPLYIVFQEKYDGYANAQILRRTFSIAIKLFHRWRETVGGNRYRNRMKRVHQDITYYPGRGIKYAKVAETTLVGKK